MELYCEKCNKLLIVEKNSCIVCINRQLDKVEKKLKKIKEYCNKTFHDGVWNGFLMDEEHRVNILKIIESEEE